MKLHPDFDFALRDILAADPAGEVVLYADRVAAVNRIVMERLGRTLGGAATRVRLLPRLDYEAYLESVHDAAVILDTPHFGGGNTTIEALSLNVPVVTLPGPFLRSRYAFARLRALGLDECIATDRDDYVARAVMIATNPALREDLVERLRERCAVHLDPTLPAAAFARALATCAGRPC
jgi:predicted O-linked N-acetylglucosamine transferase (SPINDLY family)